MRYHVVSVPCLAFFFFFSSVRETHWRFLSRRMLGLAWTLKDHSSCCVRIHCGADRREWIMGKKRTGETGERW